MEDKLKQYVANHQDEFEVFEPAGYLWDGINGRLEQSSRRVLWRRLAIAVSVLLLITCGIWKFTLDQQKSVMEATVYVKQPIIDSAAYFAAIAQKKNAQLEQYCSPEPELCKAFESDIAMLNNAYHQLEKEYATSANKKEILQAMTSNRILQVQLISRQLQIMEAVKQKKETINTI